MDSIWRPGPGPAWTQLTFLEANNDKSQRRRGKGISIFSSRPQRSTDRLICPRSRGSRVDHIGLPAIGATICQSRPVPKTQAGPFGRVATNVQLLPSAEV